MKACPQCHYPVQEKDLRCPRCNLLLEQCSKCSGQCWQCLKKSKH